MPDSPVFHERVLPSAASFIPLVLLPPVGWLTFAMINPTIGVVIGSAIAIVSAALMVLWSPKILVTSKKLVVGRAQIPLNKLGKAIEITGREVFSERGPKLSAVAYVQLQSSIKSLVKVTINDKDDSTPYWLFSTRRAGELAELLNKKR